MIGFEFAPRYAELVRRVFGEIDIVPPGIIIESDPIEYSVLRQIFRYSNDQSIAATAGQRQHIGLRNPSGSGILVVVEISKVINLTGAIRSFLWRIEDPGVLGIGVQLGSSVDGRNSRGPRAQLMTLTQVGAAGNIIWTARVPADGEYEWKDQIVLTPARTLWLECSVDNLQLNGAIRWRERPAKPEELTL